MGTIDANMQTHQSQDACAWHHQIYQRISTTDNMPLARMDVGRSKGHFAMSIGSVLHQPRPNAAEGKPHLKEPTELSIDSLCEQSDSK